MQRNIILYVGGVSVKFILLALHSVWPDLSPNSLLRLSTDDTCRQRDNCRLLIIFAIRLDPDQA